MNELLSQDHVEPQLNAYSKAERLFRFGEMVSGTGVVGALIYGINGIVEGKPEAAATLLLTPVFGLLTWFGHEGHKVMKSLRQQTDSAGYQSTLSL